MELSIKQATQNGVNGKNNGKVEINGHTYQTVAYRMLEFHKQYQFASGFSIETECIHWDKERVIFKASIKTPDGKVVATGHAEEMRGESFINRTSAFENAETSAVGRALASAGFIGSEFASADEVAQAIKSQGSQAALPAQPKSEPTSLATKLCSAQSQAFTAKPKHSALPEKAQQSFAQSEQSQAKSKPLCLPSLGKQNEQATKPDEEKAEQWVREHLGKWLDSHCPFGKAKGRTWKELAENKGDKITVNGKLSAPRDYLHALSSWTDCKGVWARIKAKVVLEVIESKNGTTPVPVEVGR